MPDVYNSTMAHTMSNSLSEEYSEIVELIEILEDLEYLKRNIRDSYRDVSGAQRVLIGDNSKSYTSENQRDYERYLRIYVNDLYKFIEHTEDFVEKAHQFGCSVDIKKQIEVGPMRRLYGVRNILQHNRKFDFNNRALKIPETIYPPMWKEFDEDTLGDAVIIRFYWLAKQDWNDSEMDDYFCRYKDKHRGSVYPISVDVKKSWEMVNEIFQICEQKLSQNPEVEEFMEIQNELEKFVGEDAVFDFGFYIGAGVKNAIRLANTIKPDLLKNTVIICPVCDAEYTVLSNQKLDDDIWCESCGKTEISFQIS